MSGTAYVIDKLGDALAAAEQAIAQRDAELAQARERIANLEAAIMDTAP